MQSIGDALRMSCGGSSKSSNASPSSDAAATTTTLVISATQSDAKSVNLPAPPVKNGHTSWVSRRRLFFFFLSLQLFFSGAISQFRLPRSFVNRCFIFVCVFFPYSFMTDEAVSRQEPTTQQSQQHPEIDTGRAREQPDGDEQVQVQQRRRQEAHQRRRQSECCRGRSGPSHAFPFPPSSNDGLQAVALFAGPHRIAVYVRQADKLVQHAVFVVLQLIKVCLAIIGERWLPPHVARADG